MKIDAESLTMHGGGPVPNVTVGLARLGFKTVLISVVGDDPFGKIGIEQLEKENVDCSFIVIKKQLSAIATGWIEKESGQRTMVLSREIFVKPEDLKLSKYPIPKIIHLDGRDLEATLKLARWGKKVGAIISFDIGSIRNDVSSVFKYVDHLVVADSYALSFTKTRSVKQAIKKLTAYCRGTIIVTEGINGSLGYENNQFFTQPAYRVKSVDATGAGDAYHSGYLYGLLQNKSIQERMMLGSVVAAIKCMKAGARAGLPTKRQLGSFLNKIPKCYPMGKN